MTGHVEIRKYWRIAFHSLPGNGWIASVFYGSFPRENVKRRFLFSNVSASNIKVVSRGQYAVRISKVNPSINCLFLSYPSEAMWRQYDRNIRTLFPKISPALTSALRESQKGGRRPHWNFIITRRFCHNTPVLHDQPRGLVVRVSDY